MGGTFKYADHIFFKIENPDTLKSEELVISWLQFAIVKKFFSLIVHIRVAAFFNEADTYFRLCRL